MKSSFFLALTFAVLVPLAQAESISLTDAATRGDTAAMTAAIAGGASVDSRNAKGWTPLICAVHAGKIEAVKLLLSEHANPNLLTVAGCAPLDFAVDQGHDDMVPLLLDARADPNGFRASLNSGGTCSTLFMAMNHEHLSTAKLLVAHGARVNDRNSLGSTALIQANFREDVEQVCWLISVGADPRLATKDENGHPFGPLEAAAREGRPYVLEALTDLGVKPAYTKNPQNEELNEALNSGDYERVQAALAKGASPTDPDSNNVLPITVAVLKGDPGIVGLLIKVGADVNAMPDGDPRGTAMALAQERINDMKDARPKEPFQRIAELLRKAGATR